MILVDSVSDRVVHGKYDVSADRAIAFETSETVSSCDSSVVAFALACSNDLRALAIFSRCNDPGAMRSFEAFA